MITMNVTIGPIEFGVPIPPRRKPGSRKYVSPKYPWNTLEVGDSFEIIHDGSNDRHYNITRSVRAAGKRLGVTFVTRYTERGTRIWRTA